MEHSEHDQSKEALQQRKAEFLDEKAEKFHARMAELMAEGREIFVLRGAGTNNGISPEDAPRVAERVTTMLRDALDAGRKIVIMYDGDEDNREKPDVGSVFGVVADTFRGNPAVATITAQKEGWYYPKTDEAALESASGTPYETYVLPDSAPLKNEAIYPDLTPQTDLTQSEALAQYDKYQQIFVGPAGPIAAAQLGDLNEKAAGRNVNVFAVATRNNPNLAPDFEVKKRAAIESGDLKKVAAIDSIIAQRKLPFGVLYTATGDRALSPGAYPNLTVVMDESIIS